MSSGGCHEDDRFDRFIARLTSSNDRFDRTALPDLYKALDDRPEYFDHAGDLAAAKNRRPHPGGDEASGA